MPFRASDEPIGPSIQKFRRFVTEQMKEQTDYAFEDMTETGKILCFPLFWQVMAFLISFRGLLDKVAPSKVLAGLDDNAPFKVYEGESEEHAELRKVRQQMYNSYEFLCRDLGEIKKEGKAIKGSVDLHDYLSKVFMYTEMALRDAQSFFEMDWNGDEEERVVYMSETHQHVKLIIEHIQFLCDQHTAALSAKQEEDARLAEDGRGAKRQRLGTPPSEPPAGSPQ